MIGPLREVEGNCCCHCHVLSEGCGVGSLFRVGGVGVFFGLFLAVICWKCANLFRRSHLREEHE